MATFKKSGKKTMPAISTGSLPDIVFMILLFFMVTTTMRQTEHMVMVNLPSFVKFTDVLKRLMICWYSSILLIMVIHQAWS